MKEQLRKIWCEVLNKEEITDRDNFFVLGGDSIKAIQIVNQIQQVLPEVEGFSLQYLFAFPTIQRLADKMSTLLTENGQPVYSVTAQQLEAEAILAIEQMSSEQRTSEFKQVLITGSTGYVGAYLIKEILKRTEAKIYCMVRAETMTIARERLNHSLSIFSLSAEDKQRLVPIVGDFSQPQLGMEQELYESLMASIDAIYHNGAMVHFLYSYDDLKQTNVDGTREIIIFASTLKIKHLFYVSTTSIFSPFGKTEQVVAENDEISDSGILTIGYTQSKWVAERLIWKAREKGLPVTVFRIGHVVGDTESGVCNHGDFVFRIAKSVLAIRAYPRMHGQISPIAVGDAARAIVALSLDDTNLGKAFHLINQQPLSFAELIGWAEQKGIDLQPLTRREWVNEIETIGQASDIYPFLKYFDDELWDQAGTIQFALTETSSALARAGVSIQPMTWQLLDKFYHYFERNGEIELFTEVISGCL